MKKLAVWWLLLWSVHVAAEDGSMRGRVLDRASGAGLNGVLVELHPLSAAAESRSAVSDSAGGFYLSGLESGRWQLRIEVMGYERVAREVEIGPGERQIEVGLQLRPLLMDEMVVRARRPGAQEQTPAFVEVIAVEEQGPGVDLPGILDRAVGVKIRRYGGLGSFSTVSIRGSTAEQVQVYMDGVPLNQAVGGGVDLGNLPTGGIESIEIYRGAVPARFGGNSIGGIVHIRTRKTGGADQLRVRATTGSFGSRQLSGSASGAWGQVNYLGVVDYSGSRNNFTFLDDNGTAYNADDDEWTRRLNNDFGSIRVLAKAAGDRGAARLQVRSTFDLKHQGIPGIGNYQAGHVRFDTWRHTTEVELFGTTGSTGYRMVGYHLQQQEQYKDLQGEVGLGTQHDRNTTRSFGMQAEANALYRRNLLTLFGGARHESFEPHNLLRLQSRLLDSRRRSASLGLEMEVPLWSDRLQLIGGTQVEFLKDTFYGQKLFGGSVLLPNRDNVKVLRGERLGGRLRLSEGWTLQGHGGRYQRPPSFYELFGDRGAVIGNTDLASEEGDNGDLGLVYRRPEGRGDGLVFLEMVFYRNAVRNLIRFVHNSQLVSRPHNLGKGLIWGVETRGAFRLLAQAQLSGHYVYQVSRNQSSLSYEKGKDLPNAPRHTLGLRAGFSGSRGELHYELSRESRHFLDRANLRTIQARTIHGFGCTVQLQRGMEVGLEIRNLTASQVADLWGYPLPGRSYFVALEQDVDRLFD